MRGYYVNFRNRLRRTRCSAGECAPGSPSPGAAPGGTAALRFSRPRGSGMGYVRKITDSRLIRTIAPSTASAA